MTYDKKLQMDPDALEDLADTVSYVSDDVVSISKYAKKYSFKKKHLGSVGNAETIASRLVDTVDELADSINEVSKEGGYLPKISKAINHTAKATKLNEEDAKWGFDKLEEGM